MSSDSLQIVPIWFDSLGAKSSCTLVITPDIELLIDSGSAVMQPSYPMPDELKDYYQDLAYQSITNALNRAEQVVISHYHYDHHYPQPHLYQNKKLWIKDPNQWINKSQWTRSRFFLKEIASFYDSEITVKPPGGKEFTDPFDSLVYASKKDFGDYQERRVELLGKWRKRFHKVREHWKNNPWIKEKELTFENTGINFAEGRTLQIGGTKIRFSRPLFHGIEYANTGWVFATIVEAGDQKLIHTSDLQGPTIEDHAQWIIKEDPDYLILDGPAVYLFGYMLNRTNLNRSINNAYQIVTACKPKTIIYDHHLLRDKRYKELTSKVWTSSENVTTAAELLGKKPLIDRISRWKNKGILSKKLTLAREKELDKDLVFNRV